MFDGIEYRGFGQEIVEDLAKYAGVPVEKIIVEEDIKTAVEIATKSDNIEERVTILPSYTALLKISKMKF